MELKTIASKWKLLKKCWKYIAVFWAFETLFFLLVNGWHIKPIDENEIFCDKIVHYSAIAFCLYLLSIVWDLLDYLLDGEND